MRVAYAVMILKLKERYRDNPVIQCLKSALWLLPSRTRKTLFLSVLAYMSLSVLDIAGVLVIGALTSIVLRGLNGLEEGNRVGALFDFLGATGISYESKVILLVTLAVSFLVTKSLLALFVSKKLSFFLANRGAEASKSLIAAYFSNGVHKLYNQNKQQSIFALTNGVSQIISGVLGSTINLMVDITLLLVMLVGLATLSPVATLATLCFFLLTAWVLHKITIRQVSDLGRRHSIVTVGINEKISTLIGTFRELYVQNSTRAYYESIGKERFEQAGIEASLQFRSSVSKYVYEIAMILGVLLIVVSQIISSDFVATTSTTAVFLAAIFRIVPALARAQQSIVSISVSLAQATISLNLVDQLKHSLKQESARDAKRFNQEVVESHSSKNKFVIEISDLSFAYDDSRRDLFNGVNLVAKKGDKIALIGKSGVGKSTFLDLVLGIATPKSGYVKLMSSDPKDLYLTNPRALCFVSQRPYLLSTSVRENLTFGLGEYQPSDQEMWGALEKVGMLSAVSKLSDGLDTPIGEGGAILSGGQRQALSIARAMIVDPQILILDEATSAMDYELERKVLTNFFKNRSLTMVIVTHRQTNLKFFDRIWKLEKKGVRVTLKKGNL